MGDYVVSVTPHAKNYKKKSSPIGLVQLRAKYRAAVLYF